MGEYFVKYSPYPEVDLKKLGAHIYQVESQASHNTYATVLESVSPFTEDFDFDGYTGFHRTIALLNFALVSLRTVNIALKVIYQMVIKEKESLDKINEILMKHDPNIEDGIDLESLKAFF